MLLFSFSIYHSSIFTLVPLTQNVYGSISFSPASSVLNGTNVTIHCNGTDGQKLDHTKHDPLLVRIQKMIIFGPDLERLKYCGRGKQLQCSHTITRTKELGHFTYYCQFLTGIQTFRCVSAKNLTITVDGMRDK